MTGDAVPAGDPYSGVTMLLSEPVADSVMYDGCLGSRIVYARIRASPYNLFVVCVYVPHAGRQNPSSTDTLGDLEALLTSVPMQSSETSMRSWPVAPVVKRAEGTSTAERTRAWRCLGG